MSTSNYKRGLLVSSFLVVALLSSNLVAHAATPTTTSATPTTTSATPTSTQGNASGLSISPLRTELTLKPGQADKIDITLKNITGGPVIAKSNVRDFQSDGVTGNPKVITDPKLKSQASIASFLIGLGDVPLATGEQKSFSVPVQIPGDAAPGAYFGLIEYQAVPVNANGSTGDNKVALSAAVSQLVFITVPGNVSDRMVLKSIHIYADKEGNKEGIFFTHIPQAVGIEMANIGNAFARPFGHVSLQNSEGKEIYTYEMNGGITRGVVLPNSTRIFKDPIKNITRPGRYTIVTNLSYGPGSAILTAKKTFWYIPAWVMAVAAGLVLLLIAGVVLARRSYKRGTGGYRRS